MTSRLRVWGGVVILAGTGLVACGSSTKSTARPEATTAAPTAGANGALSLRAGLNDPKDPNIAVLQYLPQSVTVTAESTVEWRIAGPEPHSVTFLPPGQTLPPGAPDQTLFAPTPAASWPHGQGGQRARSGTTGTPGGRR